jgi:hypothetical protein
MRDVRWVGTSKGNGLIQAISTNLFGATFQRTYLLGLSDFLDSAVGSLQRKYISDIRFGRHAYRQGRSESLAS